MVLRLGAAGAPRAPAFYTEPEPECREGWGAKEERGVEEGPGQPSVGSDPPPLDVNARRAPGARERGSARRWARAPRPETLHPQLLSAPRQGTLPKGRELKSRGKR